MHRCLVPPKVSASQGMTKEHHVAALSTQNEITAEIVAKTSAIVARIAASGDSGRAQGPGLRAQRCQGLGLASSGPWAALGPEA